MIELGKLQPTPGAIEHVARGLLGHGYREHMRASPIVGRVVTLMSSGTSSFERKLRYLFYLN